MKYLFEVHIKPGHTAEQYAAAVRRPRPRSPFDSARCASFAQGDNVCASFAQGDSWLRELRSG